MSARDRRRQQRATGWGTAALDILRAASVEQAEVARKVGISKQHLGNCLAGRRRPPPASITRINRVIARLARSPHVGPYLDCAAMLSGLLDPKQPVRVEPIRDEIGLGSDYSVDLKGLVGVTLRLLELCYSNLFREGYRERVAAHMVAEGEDAARWFAIELNQAFLCTFMGEIEPPSAPTGFAGVCDVLRRHGLDVLTVDGAAWIAWEQFQWVVRRELARANPGATANERRKSEKRIFDALHDRFELRHTSGPTADSTSVSPNPHRQGGIP